MVYNSILKTFKIELRESNLGQFNSSLRYVLMVKFYFSDFNLIYINYLDMLCYVTKIKFNHKYVL